MEVVLTNPNTGRKWRIRPLDQGKCYTIERGTAAKNQNGTKSKREFVGVECYPSTFENALLYALKYMMLDSSDPTSIKPDEAMSLEQQVSVVVNATKEFIEEVCASCKSK